MSRIVNVTLRSRNVEGVSVILVEWIVVLELLNEIRIGKEVSAKRDESVIGLVGVLDGSFSCVSTGSDEITLPDVSELLVSEVSSGFNQMEVSELFSVVGPLLELSNKMSKLFGGLAAVHKDVLESGPGRES